MAVIRQDVHPSDEEAYNEVLGAKMAPISGKTWVELSSEEKDLLLEYLSFKNLLIRPPTQVK